MPDAPSEFCDQSVHARKLIPAFVGCCWLAKDRYNMRSEPTDALADLSFRLCSMTTGSLSHNPAQIHHFQTMAMESFIKYNCIIVARKYIFENVHLCAAWLVFAMRWWQNVWSTV